MAGPDAYPSLVSGALRGSCPRCGAPTLFRGAIKFADRCRACGLDFTQFNVGDGPAAFLTLILGTLVSVGAVLIQIRWEPPLWLQLLIWVPVTAAGVVGSLRLAKAALITVEYRQRAREGHIADPDA